jgi:uncharacterized protein
LRIFISYSRSDKPTLKQLDQLIGLVYPNYTTWYDEDIVGGEEWWKRIVAEIQSATMFIFLISDESLKSEYCQKELLFAIENNLTVIPVIIRRLSSGYPGPVPEGLAEFLKARQYVDIINGFQDAECMAKLWGAIIKSIDQIDQPEKKGKIKLSRKDRWFLSNQFRILSALYPNEAKNYEEYCKIVENGYELHYDWITEYIYDVPDIVTREESLEMLDILDMFRALNYSYKKLDDKTGIDNNAIKFRGFDGNYETKYMAYVRFMIEDEEKFQESRGEYNSHIPMLNRYRKMLDHWRYSTERFDLTKEEILKIISR